MAPVATCICGTFFMFMYLWIAVLEGVPRVWNTNSTSSCSTSLRAISTVRERAVAVVMEMKFTLRPLMPPCSFTILKYAAIDFPMVP